MTTLPALAFVLALASQTAVMDPAAQPRETGDLGGACYGNDTCNAGLYCVSSLKLCAEHEKAPLATSAQSIKPAIVDDDAAGIDIVAHQVSVEDIAAAIPLAYLGNVVPFGAVFFPALQFDADLGWDQVAAYSKVAGAAALTPAMTGIIAGSLMGLSVGTVAFGLGVYASPFTGSLSFAAALAAVYGVAAAATGVAAGVTLGLPGAALLYGYFAPTAALNAWGRAEQRFEAQRDSGAE